MIIQCIDNMIQGNDECFVYRPMKSLLLLPLWRLDKLEIQVTLAKPIIARNGNFNRCRLQTRHEIFKLNKKQNFV